MTGPSAQALSEDERLLRSSLIAAQRMGLAFMRFVWKIEPLASMDDDDIVAASPVYGSSKPSSRIARDRLAPTLLPG